MAEINLTRGLVALVDDEDADVLSVCKWYANGTRAGFYAQARMPETGRRIYMHRAVMSAPPRVHVHHKNGETLDNRRENLEILTPARHQAEHHHHDQSGVHRLGDRFRAQTRIDGVCYSIGVYDFEDVGLAAVALARRYLPELPMDDRESALEAIVTEAKRRNYRALFPNGIV